MDSNSSLLLHLFETIQEIADPDYQVRVWVQGEGPECGSWEEVMCSFFDDVQAGYIIENHQKFGLSADQVQALQTLFSALSKYSENTPDIMLNADVVKDPRWKEIQYIAKKSIEVLKKHPLICRKR